MRLMTVDIQSERLKGLIAASWDAYEQLAGERFVVQPAIPILFFGDSKQYFASPLKVITVGLNPSKSEFPIGNRFLRFPAVSRLATDSGSCDLSRHLEALDSYFEAEPYKQWFGSLEPILNGLDSSYYCKKRNRALHTDLCSPIATDPTWTDLSKEIRLLLEPDGIMIWHSLVEILQPDIILISIAERNLTQIRFPVYTAPEVIWKLDRARPYLVTGRTLSLDSSKRSVMVFGRAANKPFGTVSNADKLKMGAAIKQWYDAPST
jgi:hypothetical protein